MSDKILSEVEKRREEIEEVTGKFKIISFNNENDQILIHEESGRFFTLTKKHTSKIIFTLEDVSWIVHSVLNKKKKQHYVNKQKGEKINGGY